MIKSALTVRNVFPSMQEHRVIRHAIKKPPSSRRMSTVLTSYQYRPKEFEISNQLKYPLNMDILLGTSPTAVAGSPAIAFNFAAAYKELERKKEEEQAVETTYSGFDDFLCKIPNVIQHRKEVNAPPGSKEDPVLQLLERTKIHAHDWKPYAFFDTERAYTRNLIATDHETYTLLLLCWSPNTESAIHDHPGDGCWMRVLQGQVRECRYQPVLKSSHDNDSSTTTLRCTQDMTVSEGALVFIDDSLGYHKVGNPGSIPSVSLHLYSPPIQSCNVWHDKDCAPSRSYIVHYSEFGERV